MKFLAEMTFLEQMLFGLMLGASLRLTWEGVKDWLNKKAWEKEFRQWQEEEAKKPKYLNYINPDYSPKKAAEVLKKPWYAGQQKDYEKYASVAIVKKMVQGVEVK